jgi:hypothetical protein
MPSATARAAPIEWVIQMASATQNPSSSGAGPSSGAPSGVKENRPLIPSTGPWPARSGSRSTASAHEATKSSGVKGSTEGMPTVPVPMAPGSTGMGRWA